jgi:hypothetical protein
MYVLPYIHVPKTAELHQVWLFLERNGTYLIEVEDLSGATDFAAANDLELEAEPHIVGDVIYCRVKKDSQYHPNFYTWAETPAGTPPREVWRSFLWLGDATDPYGVNKLMDSLKLSDEGHTVYTALSQITV